MTFVVLKLKFVKIFILYFGDPELGLAFCATAMMTIALCVAKISTSYCRFKTSAEIAFHKTKQKQE